MRGAKNYKAANRPRPRNYWETPQQISKHNWILVHAEGACNSLAYEVVRHAPFNMIEPRLGRDDIANGREATLNKD